MQMKLTETFDSTDLELIILLQEKPIANYSLIGKLLGLSSPTVKRRIDGLYSKVINRIVAIPKYSRLNLVPSSIFLEVNYTNFDKIEKIIDLHPYLYFRVRTYGKINGIHATFRLPQEGANYLKSFVKELINKNIAKNYLFFEHYSDYTIRGTPRFSAYTSKSGSWEFSWQKWISTPKDKVSRKDPIDDNIEHPKQKEKNIEFSDLEILSLLSADSRQKNVNILNKLTEKLSPQRLSDKLQEIKQKYISTYRVYLNWGVFDFTEVIFNVKTDSDFFKQLLSTYPPPFQTTFRDYVDTNGRKGFLLYLSCPPSHLIDAFESLMKISNDVELYLMNRKQQYRAPLNIKAFDKKKMDWIVSEDYLVLNLFENKI